MSVRLQYRGAYDIGGHQPWPVIFGYINDDLIDFWIAGMVRKRVKFLPSWIPFNTFWDFSHEGEQEIMRRVRTHLEEMEYLQSGEAGPSGPNNEAKRPSNKPRKNP